MLHSMQFGFIDLLTLLGALGFFIYGMKVMSEGIQKIAGNRLRSILSSMTDNPLSGILTGLGITSLIQSSSATTVMVVSFVNAGLLNLRQSIRVIMGANIGTTMTAWLISIVGFSKVSLDAYSLPIIALGFPLLFSKKSNYRHMAEFLIGFALLFMGLSALKNSVPELTVTQLSYLRELENLGFVSTLLFVGIGTLLTIIIQSSSAAMALTLALCAHGLPVELGAAIVMGENIGTTITANLAALIGNTASKRSARAHFIFNVFGVIWLLVIFQLFVHGVGNFASSMGWWADPFKNPYDQEAVTRTLALFHTSFNIINTLLLVWFIPYIEKAVTLMVPERSEPDKGLKYLSFELLDTPELALSAVRNEIFRYLDVIKKMFNDLNSLTAGGKKQKPSKKLEKIKKSEDLVNVIHKGMTNYLVRLNQKPLSEEIAQRGQMYFSISHNLENIGDLIHSIASNLSKQIDNEVKLPKDYRTSLESFINAVSDQISIISDQFGNEKEVDREDLIHALNLLKESEIFQIKPAIYDDLEKGKYSIDTGLELTRLLMWAEQISFKVDNILKVLIKNPLKPEEID